MTHEGSAIARRLSALREQMRQHGLTAYLVPTADAHQSEYVPAWWRRREWISGFTGSSGQALITLDNAFLWTDSRYFLQSEKELDPALYLLVRQGAPGQAPFPRWVAEVVAGGRLGIDPRVVTARDAKAMRKAVQHAGGELELIDRNLVDAVWTDRPEPSRAPLRPLGQEFSGESPAAKISRVQEALVAAGCDALLVTNLDAVAWLFDVRGSDVDFNPVAAAYAMVTRSGASLFVDEAKLTDALAGHLPPSVTTHPYDEFGTSLRQLAGAGACAWMEPDSCSAWAVRTLRDGGAKIHAERSPVTMFKARKNATEVEGARRSHVRDGVALVRFLAWLEQTVGAGHVSEVEAAARLEGFRAEGQHYQGLSFDTISAFAEHGAVVHYRPAEEGHRLIDGSSLYLVDSGGQYLDGTTDVTRTVCLGTPTEAQCEEFTRVLRGHVALARVVFPAGTTGTHLDVLARAPLWEVGLNYGHGTGHGVGSYLCVHEGPQRISPSKADDVALEAGMILSNEPGCYTAGSHGIRIESLVVVTERPGHGRSENFLGFDTMTMCPIDRKLIDLDLLTPDERRWVDDYHRAVREALTPHLDETTRAWLTKATAAL